MICLMQISFRWYLLLLLLFGVGWKEKEYRKKGERKEKDEELVLFRELHKREKDRNNMSLLQPVSDEFVIIIIIIIIIGEIERNSN